MNKDRITIRKATLNDVGTLTENRIIFLNETYGTTSPEKESDLRQTLTEYFIRAFENHSFISWIAEYENKPVGFSGMVVREQPANFEIPNGKTGYILNMFTIKEFRKNGICKLLFQRMIEESEQLNLNKIELHATNEGEPIYRQFGFKEPHDKA